MKKQYLWTLAGVAVVLPLGLCAETFSISRYKIAGGGGTSTNAQFSVSGTIGQVDAGAQMQGGTFALSGGFWGQVQAIQSVGRPTLYVSRGSGSVTLYWASTDTFSLERSTNLAVPQAWQSFFYDQTFTNGTNYVTITPPVGNVFYRLRYPAGD